MPREIVSKYFCKQVMEESLNDFQETRTKYIGPKIIKKTKQRAKPKKRVKGQKDIRTLIKKKNELVTFTKDFNNVCTKSGIDIDSQELQLAIALSKSLHEQTQFEAGTSQSNKSLTSQERTNQIRRTLQEYGFKVPETKIKSEANKRVKKYKKPYKLLLITEEERREKISDKYSQILFQYPDPEDLNGSDYNEEEINKDLFYLCTNITYNFLKSNDIFYVSNLLQEITVEKGSLLRDWSDIPGRPCSPVLTKDLPTSISDIDCTSAELNTILSGTLTAAQEILKSKINYSLENIKTETVSEQCNQQCEEQDTTCEQVLIKPEREINESNAIPINKTLENSTEYTETTMLSCKERSLSPDLFGDDASSIIDNTINHNFSVIATSKHSKRTDNALILDLTEPTNINLAEPHNLPETSDVTKRKSNDFMDLTECVSSSQRNKVNLISQSTKTCESKIIYNDCMEITECIKPSLTKCNANVNTVVTVDTHIDLVTENDSFIDKKNVTLFDLTQSSNSDDDLPMVNIRGSRNSSNDTLIVDYDDYGQFSNNEDVIELNTDNVDVEKNTNTQNDSLHISDKDKTTPVEKVSKNAKDYLEICDIVVTKISKNIHSDKNNSVSFIQDVPEHVFDNKVKSMPVPEVNENSSRNCLEISKIDLTQCLDNVHNEENNLVSFKQDVSKHIFDNNDKSILVDKVNEIISSKTLEISDIDLTQTSDTDDVEKDNSISFTQDVSRHIFDKNNKSILVDKVDENKSNKTLEVRDVDLTQSSDTSDIEKNNSVSFTQDASLHISENNVKSISDDKANENNSKDSLQINDIGLTHTLDTDDIEKDNSVSFTQDVSRHISENNDKSIQYEKLNDNSKVSLEINTDLSQTSENCDIEKNSSVSFIQYVSNNDKAINERNKNKSEDNLEISDIDLTQSSGSTDIQRTPIEEINIPCDNYNNLGKIGDVSIDYDEVCIDTAKDYCTDEHFDDILSKYGTSSSNVSVLSKNSVENSKNNLASSYNTSEVFKLSDRELNYSLCRSHTENFKSCDISFKNDNFNLDNSKDKSKSKRSLNRSLSDSCLPAVTFENKVCNTNKQMETYIKLNESIHSTPIKAIIQDDKISVETPTNSEYVIKVGEVTPMLDYEAMSSPERNKELEKYGLKPFKRKRGQMFQFESCRFITKCELKKVPGLNNTLNLINPAIQLLTHLYNQTHPIVEYCSEELIPAKKLKANSPSKKTKSPKKKSHSPSKRKSIVSTNTGLSKENEIYYEETKDLPDIRDIECSSDDWVFQKREKAKVHSCRVPLHIAFHNYVSCRRGLREAILRYEPVNIDVIHKDLVSYGYRYNPKDLLKFLDKKCITVKTSDNNARNSKK